MKNRFQDMAIFGSPAAFPEPLHVGRPNIGDRDHLLSRVKDMLDRRWLTNSGPYVKEFEKRIAEFVGVKHCVAVCNATIGLETSYHRSWRGDRDDDHAAIALGCADKSRLRSRG